MKQMWQFTGHQQAVSYCAFMPSSFNINACSLQERSLAQKEADPLSAKATHDKAALDKAPVSDLKAHNCKLDADQNAATEVDQQPALCLTEDEVQDEAGEEVATEADNGDCTSLMVATASADCSVKLWQYGRTEAVDTLHVGNCASMPTTVAGASCAVDENALGHSSASTLLFMGNFQGDLLSSAL